MRIGNRKALVLHDAFLFPGGGERVALELADLLSADLVTGKFLSQAFPPGFLQCPVTTLETKTRPFPQESTQTISLAWKFLSMPRQERECAVFSGPVSLLGTKRVHGLRIHYCHTPPRMVYDLAQYYLNAQKGWKRPLLAAFMALYRRAVDRAVRHMDLVIANSEHVRGRIARYWGIAEAPVVYPPCGKGFVWVRQGDYYLSMARLDPLKRVDLIIQAFQGMPDKKLVIASDGPAAPELRRLARDSPHIAFTGPLGDADFKALVGGCLATVYVPVDEDFGMSPAESMAAGKPVIGVDAGGLRETIVHGRTGWLLPERSLNSSLCELVRNLTAERLLAMRDSCEKRALLFHPRRFRTAIRELLLAKWPGLQIKEA